MDRCEQPGCERPHMQHPQPSGSSRRKSLIAATSCFTESSRCPRKTPAAAFSISTKSIGSANSTRDLTSPTRLRLETSSIAAIWSRRTNAVQTALPSESTTTVNSRKGERTIDLHRCLSGHDSLGLVLSENFKSPCPGARFAPSMRRLLKIFKMSRDIADSVKNQDEWQTSRALHIEQTSAATRGGRYESCPFFAVTPQSFARH